MKICGFGGVDKVNSCLNITLITSITNLGMVDKFIMVCQKKTISESTTALFGREECSACVHMPVGVT